MTCDLTIRGGKLVTPQGVIDADLAVDGGRIVEIGSAVGANVGPGRTEIAATGLHVFPGLIDAHVHFNEPGRTDWEGFATGSAALAAGGGTCFFDMPLNSDPPLLDAAAFDAKHAAARAHSRTDFAFWGGLTPTNLDQMPALAQRGVVGFKAFMSESGIPEFARADDLTLVRGMRIAAELGLPVAVHAESEAITSRLAAEAQSKGAASWADFVDSRPALAEVEAVSRAITLAAEAGCRLHIVHVSTARAAERVHTARERDGIDVTCETCPHYLSFTADDLAKQGSALKCAPPLRSADEVAALWKGVADGRFAFVGSDHSPCPPDMKSDDEPFDSWGGIPGVQSTLGVMLSHKPHLASDTVARLTAQHPAQRFGLAHKGQIAPGFDADLTLVDLDASFTLTLDALRDRHRLSPYVGRIFRGAVHRTLVRGHTVFQDGELVGDFRGRLVTPGEAPR